ncbi:MAG: hypothetical protein ACOCWG_01965 [bacterium]
MESIEIEVLDSMIRVLQRMEEKLKDEDIIGDINESARLQNKKKWVEEQIENWQEFIRQ